MVKYFIRRKILKIVLKLVFHSICFCLWNISLEDNRFEPFAQPPTFCMFYNHQVWMFFSLGGMLDLRFWPMFGFSLLLSSCKLILSPFVFGESQDLLVIDIRFQSCTFSWCRSGGNTTELVLAGTQWFSFSNLMMDVLSRFSFRRQFNFF